MPKKNTNTLPAVGKSELGGRHILDTMRDVIANEHALTKEEQEQFHTHLLTCQICQYAFEEIVKAVFNDSPDDTSSASAREQLAQLEEAHQRNQERDELIAAYVETIEMSGAETVAERYPALHRHIEECEICQAEVEDIRIMLRRIV